MLEIDLNPSILTGLGFGIVFILLGITMYFFLSCTNNSQTSPQIDNNIFVNAKSGNINLNTPSATKDPGLGSEETSEEEKQEPNFPAGYYPVREKRQTEGDSSSKALSPNCVFPLLALVASAIMCFIVMFIILCYLSTFVNKD